MSCGGSHHSHLYKREKLRLTENKVVVFPQIIQTNEIAKQSMAVKSRETGKYE